MKATSVKKALPLMVSLFVSACAFIRDKESPSNFFISNEIQKEVDRAQRDGQLPAVGALVMANGKTIYLNVQGKRAIQRKALAKIDDVWHLASNTKAMTALLVALAIQEGKFNYADKISHLLNRNIKIHRLNADLTIEDLLTHSSGLKDAHEVKGGKLWDRFYDSKSSLVDQRKQLAKAVLEEAPYLDPLKRKKPLRKFRYTNTNYILLGAILEKSYGKNWEDLIQQKLFQPLKMHSCGFGVGGKPNEIVPSQPWPHALKGKRLIGLAPKFKADNPAMVGPAGAVHCSLKDWKKFTDEMIRIWKQQSSLLSNKEIEKSFFLPSKVDSCTQGGGWFRIENASGVAAFQHSGSNTYNFSNAFIVPDKGITILLVTNSGQPNAEKAIQNLNKTLLKLLYTLNSELQKSG